MQDGRKHDGLSEYAEQTIHYKARSLVGKAGYTEGDVEDIEQELRLTVLERMSRFDRTRASEKTFVSWVVERKSRNLIRDRLREKRDVRREECSLNAYAEDGNGEAAELISNVDADAASIRVGRRRRTHEEDARMRLEVAEVLSQISGELRAVAEQLMAGQTVTEAARSLGIPRSTLYDMLAKLRLVFENAGFGKNFSEVADTSDGDGVNNSRRT